jgi:hypothetical protein
LLNAQRKFSACPTGFEPAKPPWFLLSFEIGGATLAMADHADHIHIGFSPEPATVFSPLQWTDLLERLRQIENPVVPRTEDVKARFGKRSP